MEVPDTYAAGRRAVFAMYQGLRSTVTIDHDLRAHLTTLLFVYDAFILLASSLLAW